jgi:cyclomaltodextrinase / maltogenic alpha-amylase / neopullulanase
MSEITDNFFEPYVTPHEQRRRANALIGLEHGERICPRAPQPGEPIHLQIASNAALPVDHIAVYYTTDDTAPVGQSGVVRHGNILYSVPGEQAYDSGTSILLQHWDAVIPPQSEGTLVRYRIDGWSDREADAYWIADTSDPLGAPSATGREYAFDIGRAATPPDWSHDAVIYNIFVDRFATASDEKPIANPGSEVEFFGGTLRGITEKLEYIQSLGITCIWLSPIFDSPTYHGYNPSSYTRVAERYGGNEALHELVEAAHKRGMRVMLDFIANHTSDENEHFQRALHDPDSSERLWYKVGKEWAPHGYLAYYRVKDMPQLDTNVPGVRAYLFDAMRYWLDTFDIDGIRLDYVSGPPPGFWTLYRRAVKEHADDIFLLGEVSGGMPEIAFYDGRIDAYMDFSLTRMLRRVFAQRKSTIADLLDFFETRQIDALRISRPATLLDNHDMSRFLWQAGNDKQRLRLAALVQLTLPGTPIVYYGTEVGLSQHSGPLGQDVYARLPMLWDDQQDRDLFADYRSLIALRQDSVALRRGDWRRIPVANETTDVGAYARQAAEDGALVIINHGREPLLVTIMVPGTDIMHLTRVGERVFSHQVTVDDSLTIEIPAMSGICLCGRRKLAGSIVNC